MQIIQYILLLFLLFAIYKTYRQHVQKLISRQSFFIWLAFWIIVAIVVILPKNTDALASSLGVGRGADLFVYISIIFLYYVVFKFFGRLQKTNTELTQLVRKLAEENPHNFDKEKKQNGSQN